MNKIFRKEVIEKNLSVLEKRYSMALGCAHRNSSLKSGKILPGMDDKGFINLIIEKSDGQKIPIYSAENKPDRKSSWHLFNDLENHDVLIFFGLGLGYDCIEVVRNLVKKPRIIVIEPFQFIFQLAIRMINLTEVFSYSRLELLVGLTDSIEKNLQDYRQMISIGKVRLITIPSYRLAFGKQVADLEEELRDRIRAIRDNWHTTKKNGKRILSNTIKNLSSLFAGSGLNSINGQFKATPAFCIAAGPSLDAALGSLKLIQNNAVIIACDSAINALLNAGIFPNIVITTDIFETNFDKIKNNVDRLRDSLLVYGIESNPDNVKKFLGPKKVAVSSSSKILLDWLGPKLNLTCKLPPLTSVSQMSIFLAQMLGAEPIILVGMDLSYTKESSHAADSVMQLDLNSKKLISIPGVNGNCVFSSPQLVADKIFMESVITNSNTRFIHTSTDGALIRGTVVKSFEEVMTTEIKSNADVKRKFEEVDWTFSFRDTETITELNEMLHKVAKIKNTCAHKEKAISEVVKKFDTNHISESFAERCIDYKRDLQNFQSDNCLLLGILELAIGDEIHEALKKRERIEAGKYKNQQQKIQDEICVVRDYYRDYCKAAEFFYDRIEVVSSNLEKALALKHHGNGDDIRDQWNKHLELGKHHAEVEEIWQAEIEYRIAIQIRPEDPSPWLRLAKMFDDSELWRPARDNVEQACSLFPNNTELINLKADIEDKIKGIMSQIKDVWVAGDKETTRRLLNGYLLLCPGDEQANLLKEVLKEVDETLAAESPIVQHQKSSQLPFDELVANASKHIEKLEFEPAVGIMEGLIQNYPQKKAAFREKIGDIRMLQNDYPSAIWNYRQALDMAPQAADLWAKIENAQRLEISP